MIRKGCTDVGVKSEGILPIDFDEISLSTEQIHGSITRPGRIVRCTKRVRE